MDKALVVNKQMVLLGTAEAISNIGNWITMMAVYSLLVFQGNGGVAESSGVFLAGLLPMLILSPLAGRLADSFPKIMLMIASNLLSGVTIAFIVFVKEGELIYLCLSLQAAFLSVMAPARQGLVPELVPSAGLTRANALLQQIASLTKIFGPMIGALVVGLLGPHQAVLLDLISFIISAALLGVLLQQHSTLKTISISNVKVASDPQSRDHSKTPVCSTLLHNPALRLLFSATFLGVIAIMSYDILASVYTRDILHADESFYGMMIGCIGFGSVLSGLYLMIRKTHPHPLRDLAYGILLLAVLLFSLVFGTFVDYQAARVIALTGALIGGWGNGLTLVQSTTLLQLSAPPTMLGRLAGLFQSTLVAGQLISMFITPLFVPTFVSIGAYLGFAGMVLTLLAITILLILQRQPQCCQKGELVVD